MPRVRRETKSSDEYKSFTSFQRSKSRERRPHGRGVIENDFSVTDEETEEFEDEESTEDYSERESTISKDLNHAPVRIKYKILEGPQSFLLFDGLLAQVVAYDDEDDLPIVEFSHDYNRKLKRGIPVECGICQKVMPKRDLHEHTKVHLKPGTKRFVCPHCGDHFISRTYTAGHTRRHIGLRPYMCPICKMHYCTKQDLRVHEQRRHRKKQFICEHCGKMYGQQTSLTNHRALVHEQRRRFQCTYCDKFFLRNYGMIEHIRNVHENNRRLIDCQLCELKFKDPHKLAKHRKDYHSKQSVFECRHCGLEFTSIEFFDAHRRSLQCRDVYRRKFARGESIVVMEKGEINDREHQAILESEVAEEIEEELHQLEEADILEEVLAEELLHRLSPVSH